MEFTRSELITIRQALRLAAKAELAMPVGNFDQETRKRWAEEDRELSLRIGQYLGLD